MTTPEQPCESDAVRRYRCRHVTRYHYGEEVPVSHHMAHLIARPHPLQHCRRTALTVTPAPAVRTDLIDYFGNPMSYVSVQAPHRGLIIVAESEIEVSAAPAWLLNETPPWETLQISVHRDGDYDGREDGADILQYAFDSIMVQTSRELADYAAASFEPDRPIAAAAYDLMRRIHEDFIFDPTATTVATPLSEVIVNRRGVCQDFAHLLVGCARSLRLPARYVSGYLRTIPPPGKPRLIGADVSHAWGAVYCGDGRWLDLCPTNGRIVDQDFITLAWGRDFDDVSPVRGVIHGSTGHGLSVEVDVEPLD
jgi:transglutaminase-like putative cysteine protease